MSLFSTQMQQMMTLMKKNELLEGQKSSLSRKIEEVKEEHQVIGSASRNGEIEELKREV